MKKVTNSVIFLSLFLCFCTTKQSTQEVLPKKSETEQSVAPELIEKIKNDENIFLLYDLVRKTGTIINYKSHQEEAISNINKINETANLLLTEYGKENLFLALEQLRLSGDSSGSPQGCVRKADGSADWSDCNFWETIVAALTSGLGCYRPRYMDGPEVYNEYLNCVQQVICQKC